MSSVRHSAFVRTFGLRLALWYATLFIVGAIAIVVLTYLLTASSLEQRDRQIIQAKLGQYAATYERGGIQELADTVRADKVPRRSGYSSACWTVGRRRSCSG
jgi:hypothetical protein